VLPFAKFRQFNLPSLIKIGLAAVVEK